MTAVPKWRGRKPEGPWPVPEGLAAGQLAMAGGAKWMAHAHLSPDINPKL